MVRWGILSVYQNPLPHTGLSAPQHLTITVLSSRSLVAEWVEPADDGGDAAVTYTITLQGGPGATTRTVSSLRTTFTGLAAPNTYTVTVAAENCGGLSPAATSTISFHGNLHIQVHRVELKLKRVKEFLQVGVCITN